MKAGVTLSSHPQGPPAVARTLPRQEQPRSASSPESIQDLCESCLGPNSVKKTDAELWLQCFTELARVAKQPAAVDFPVLCW